MYGPDKISLSIRCNLLAMKSRFLALHPLIGTKHKPSSLNKKQRSPYYWWWAYLKRNEDYLRCCERNGDDVLASLYADFGDVRGDEFAEWWGRSTQRGAKLFAEQPLDLKLQKVTTAAQCAQWATNNDVMVVAVNMAIGRRQLQSYFAHLLQAEHKGKRGRIALGKVVSTARYPLYRNFTTQNLMQMLTVYDAWLKNERLSKEEHRPLWAVGESVRLVGSAMPERGDTKYVATAKHNIMTVAVSRYVKQAKVIIANTALGVFPKSTL